jgi:hypothetical protein
MVSQRKSDPILSVAICPYHQPVILIDIITGVHYFFRSSLVFNHNVYIFVAA